jgi:hypothetical protein
MMPYCVTLTHLRSGMMATATVPLGTRPGGSSAQAAVAAAG